MADLIAFAKQNWHLLSNSSKQEIINRLPRGIRRMIKSGKITEIQAISR